ncbi:MAG: diguanylate cyclase [Synechocystis sp.]|nr:diguanylate cyclase [Synechocystis sp.]
MNTSNHPLRILLIENQLPQVALLKLLLEWQHYFAVQIQVAASLQAGIQYLKNTVFDIVLLDLFLPDGIGIDGLIKIKPFIPHTPVIVLTTVTDLSMGLATLQQGAEDYLIKDKLQGGDIARAVIYAMERRRIKQQLNQQIEREKLMGRILEEIRLSLDLSIILQTTVEEVRKFLQVDRVLIYRCYSHKTGRVLVEAPNQLSPKQTRRRQAMVTNLQYFLKLAATESETSPTLLSITPELEGVLQTLTNTILTVPIWQHLPGEEKILWGQLIAQDFQGTRHWQDWEIEFLHHLSSQVAIAIQQSELFAKVHYLANMDGLTRIANRRYFDQFLTKQWHDQGKYHQYLSLVLCDIDFFKQYNDHYGHLEGDECLKKVANILRKLTRRGTDLAARYGGEEFALILPRTNLPGCNTLIQQLQSLFAEAKIPHKGSTVNPYLTLSIGSATVVPSEPLTPEKLITMADQALYQAKNLGRNRHVSASTIGLMAHIENKKLVTIPLEAR